MDKTTAQRVVRETLKAPFDPKRFRDFASELCNGFNEGKAIDMMVPDAFLPHVKRCRRLGTYATPDGELADILVVHLTQPFKLHRARTALRDFVAHKLKREKGGTNSYKEAGLVAFVAPDGRSWRFSFVRMDYETRRDPASGKIKTEERLTPARRYSYLVGEDEECHTAQTRFLTLLQNTSDSPTLSQIEDAFSVEPVTREFFREYLRLFEETEAELAKLAKRDPAIREEFKSKGVSTVDFAKKLLGQIVFLYFVQRKGWLGVPRGGAWGDGPPNFMRRLASRAVEEKASLFDDVLEPLFYDTLATERGDDAWCRTFDCRIPFLNGGLFEPLGDYDWKRTKIELPNALFVNKTVSPTGDVGTGILDVFDRYNFTVNESEPLEKEVAIDPEMLGKVFENLIEENRRKGLGAFYTPREIVHYMCQESLINYLDQGLNHPTKPLGAPTPEPTRQTPLFVDSDEQPEPKRGQLEFTEAGARRIVACEDLGNWIRQSDQFAHYASAIAAGTKGDHYPKPPDSIRKYAIEIDSLLREITVCDPAIGSGAFPVGMMTEIVRARVALTPYLNDLAERTPYHFKRHAIQSCLYGVDIDLGAVEIAKLRLWLSLVVDEDDVRQIKPLPNLDYKVVVGNSLMGVEKNLFNNEQFKRLEVLKPKFFDESNRAKKADYKQQIEDLIHELTNGREIFDFEIYFSEVFHLRGGFDVVIANPPYVRHETISEIAPMLRQRFSVAASRADLLIFFFEQGVNLLREGGVLTLISSNKFHRAAYGAKLRPFLTQKLQIETLIDFGDAPVFEAIAYASILIGRKGDAPGEHHIRACAWRPEDDFSSLPQTLAREGIRLAQSHLAADGWRLESPAAIHLLAKVRKAGIPVGEFVDGRFYYGIKTGLNEAFVLTREQRDRLIGEDRKSAKLIKPYLRGRDVKRWIVHPKDLYLIVFPHDFHRELKNYPAILRHLTHFQAQLKDRGQCKSSRGNKEAGQHHWLELDNNPKPEYLDSFAGEKIVMPAIERSAAFAVDQAGHYSNDKTNICVAVAPHALCAILNSKVLWWTLTQTAATKQNGYYEFKPLYIRQLPIPPANATDKAKLTVLAERAAKAAATGDDPGVARAEKEINEIVYRLFGLTGAEIALVEGSAIQ